MTRYEKKVAALAKKLVKLENEVAELRHGVGNDLVLSSEERMHVTDLHRSVIDAQIKAGRRVPLTEAQFVAEQAKAKQEQHDALMGR